MVLDCFERLAWRGEVSVVEALLKDTGASLLLTSRTMVEVRGVERLEIGSLAFGSLREAAESLFLDLAGLDPTKLDPRESTAISETCATLDGVPLALAVARESGAPRRRAPPFGTCSSKAPSARSAAPLPPLGSPSSAPSPSFRQRTASFSGG